MKDMQVKRWLYQDSEGFKEGIEVGKMETIDKARQWFEDRFYNGGMRLLANEDGGYREAYDICCGFESIQEMVNDFRKAMEE